MHEGCSVGVAFVFLIKIVKRPNDWRSCVYANVKRRVFMVN